MSNIVLFLPCYNCEKQIVRVLEKLNNNENYEFFSEILVIDNGSADNTVNSAIEKIKTTNIHNIRVVKNSQNVGLGGTHKLAFRYASSVNSSHVAVLHGDDQGDINDLIQILKSGEHERHDCCLGSRFDRQSKLVGYSKFRIFGNWVFNAIFSLSAGNKITDLGSGLNIYRVSAVNDTAVLKFANDLTFNCYMILYSMSRNQKVSFFPITWREEDQVSNVKLFSQAKKTFFIAANYFFKREESLVCKTNKIDFEAIEFIEQYPRGKND